MAGSRKAVIDTIIANIFRYALLFGLTTQVYDIKKHQFVHSRRAHCYSLLLHLTFVALVPVFYKLSEIDTQLESFLFENLLIVISVINFFAIFVCIAVQGASRTNASTLCNEIIQIWHKDMAPFQGSSEIKRQAACLFIFKTLTSVLIIFNEAFATYQSGDDWFEKAKNVYILLLSNIIMGVMFLFCSGLVFSQYIFRILNYNLTRLLVEISSLRSTHRPRYALRYKIAVLEKELCEIGLIHAQLQKWVVRFKNLYQVDVLLILMSFFTLQVVVLFILFVVIHAGPIRELLFPFIQVCSSAILRGLDLTSLFYICRELLHASQEAGEIMKDLPAHELCCIQLERCVEMMCFQFKREKLRLKICGLVDLDWSSGIAMTEAALLYVILLIQIDYQHFSK